MTKGKRGLNQQGNALVDCNAIERNKCERMKKGERQRRRRRKEKGREYIRLEDKRAINLQETYCKSE